MKLIRCEVMTKNSKKEFVTPTKSIDGEKIKKKYAVMMFSVDVQDTDTSDDIEDKMFNEIESYLDVIGIRMDCIKIVDESVDEEIIRLIK